MKFSEGKWTKINPVVNEPNKVGPFGTDQELKDPQVMINEKEKKKIEKAKQEENKLK
jgi:hypothetical protein